MYDKGTETEIYIYIEIVILTIQYICNCYFDYIYIGIVIDYNNIYISGYIIYRIVKIIILIYIFKTSLENRRRTKYDLESPQTFEVTKKLQRDELEYWVLKKYRTNLRTLLNRMAKNGQFFH